MFRIDMHVHTVLGGDALIRPEDVVGRALEVGLDAVCITEHHSFDVSAPFDAISEKTGFPVLRGFEYGAAEGHLLVYGVHAGRSDMPPGLPMQTVIDRVLFQGGVAIPAHPFQKTMRARALGLDLLGLKNLVAVETVNGSVAEAANLKAQEAAAKMGLSGIGGSDAHGIQVMGRVCTVFQEPVETVSALVSALKAGGYHPEKRFA